MVMAHISGQTGENTKGNGRTIKCMAEESLHGLMAESTKENTLKTRSKVKVPFIGQMEGDILGLGLTENNMGRELSWQLMVNRGRESGIMAKGRNGSTKSLLAKKLSENV